MNPQDEKLLEQLGLQSIPEQDKKAVLSVLDERLQKRFLANALMSLPDDKRTQLEQKVEAMDNPDVAEVIKLVFELHPDARAILIKSAQEIIGEQHLDTTKPNPPSVDNSTPTATTNSTTSSGNSGNYY